MSSTNFVNGVTLTDQAWFNDVDTIVYGTLSSVTGTNTVTASGPQGLSAYALGQVFRFIPANTNTGATTLNVSSLGAKDVYSGGAACVGNELISGVPALVIYDGTRFNIVSFSALISGNLIVGAASGSNHRLVKAVAEGTTIANIESSTTGQGSLTVSAVSGTGANGAATAILLNKNSSTGRSANAAGTLNASGADYAEYEHNNGLTIAKGQIVGFKPNGTLTLTFSEAVRFGVKSTDPAMVGGDTWGVDLEGDELEAARQQVDRVAYSGKVPVNVYGATPGDYVIAVNHSGVIAGEVVSSPDFGQYLKCVGRVNRILEDGRAEIAVIVH